MEKAFKRIDPLDTSQATNSRPGKGGMAQQLKSLAGPNGNVGGMWPWRGYAGFRFADARGAEGVVVNPSRTVG